MTWSHGCSLGRTTAGPAKGDEQHDGVAPLSVYPGIFWALENTLAWWDWGFGLGGSWAEQVRAALPVGSYLNIKCHLDIKQVLVLPQVPSHLVLGVSQVVLQLHDGVLQRQGCSGPCFGAGTSPAGFLLCHCRDREAAMGSWSTMAHPTRSLGS